MQERERAAERKNLKMRESNGGGVMVEEGKV